mmetsp:Transcript_24053/g.18348  ORF Transcript_24053/g.18348 Transcript_24053/m.18348 type:complete len:181 (+) Transcript_24053:854-1396(+)
MKMVLLRVKLKQPFISDRWKWCLFVGVSCAIVSFPVTYMRFGDRRIVNTFFSHTPLDQHRDAYLWSSPSITFNLLIYCTLKFIINILSLSCQIPAGACGPIFILGSGVGRLFGHTLNLIGQQFGLTLVKYEGIYAIIGAAAMQGSATKTIAPAIMVLEITGQTTHIVPVFMGVLMAYAVA